jgi:hypothetical protein
MSDYETRKGKLALIKYDDDLASNIRTIIKVEKLIIPNYYDINVDEDVIEFFEYYKHYVIVDNNVYKVLENKDLEDYDISDLSDFRSFTNKIENLSQFI